MGCSGEAEVQRTDLVGLLSQVLSLLERMRCCQELISTGSICLEEAALVCPHGSEEGEEDIQLLC